jgi:hypothetical protein
MARFAFALVTLCLATLNCGRQPANSPRAYALVSVGGHPVPISFDVAAQVSDSIAAPCVLPCGTWITDGVMIMYGDSAWSRSIREIDTCATPAETLRENQHGPLRVLDDSVQLHIDQTGFVYERGGWHGDSIVLLQRMQFGDANGTLPWVWAATMRPRPNDR